MYKFLEQTAADSMTPDVKTVSRSLTLRELEDLFERDDFNAYPVEEDQQIVGLVSKFDFLASFVFTPARVTPRYEDLMKRAGYVSSDAAHAKAATFAVGNLTPEEEKALLDYLAFIRGQKRK